MEQKKIKMSKPKAKFKENFPQADLFPISALASQMMEDVEHIYGPAMQRKAGESVNNAIPLFNLCLSKGYSWFNKFTNNCLLRHLLPNRESVWRQYNSQFSGPKKGELIVIAARSQQLREKFLLCLTHSIALTHKQTVAIYSVSNSFIQIAWKLVNVMAEIPSGTGVYDGQLNDEELKRLSLAFTKLKAAQILLYPSSMIQLDDLCETIRKLHQQSGEIGLVLVDGVQYLANSQYRCIDTQRRLIRLKALAEELMVPVVALYQLDPTFENHLSPLTRYELGEVEMLSELTDGFMLMSGTRDDLAFAPPKILNAKSVEWLGQVWRE